MSAPAAPDAAQPGRDARARRGGGDAARALSRAHARLAPAHRPSVRCGRRDGQLVSWKYPRRKWIRTVQTTLLSRVLGEQNCLKRSLPNIVHVPMLFLKTDIRSLKRQGNEMCGT